MEELVKIYKFTCGYIGISKKIHCKNVCPKCGSGIIGGVWTCEDCGKTFVSNRNGKSSCRCPECYAKFDRARRSTYDKQYQKTRATMEAKRKIVKKITFANKLPSPSARAHCKFYDHCLKFALKENLNACQGCKLYVFATNSRRGCGANHRVKAGVS